MAWTYDPDHVEQKDEIRFMVGDTDTEDQLVQDEEIERFLVLYPRPVVDKPNYLAAAAVADAIAGRFARNVQFSTGPIARSQQQRFEHYQNLGNHLRVMHQTGGLGERVPGVVVPGRPILGGGGNVVLGSL